MLGASIGDVLQLAQLEVIDVAPCDVPASCPPGLWPCGNCGESHPVQSHWVVTYSEPPFHSHNKTLVCENCADALRRQDSHDRRRQRREQRRARRQRFLGRLRR